MLASIQLLLTACSALDEKEAKLQITPVLKDTNAQLNEDVPYFAWSRLTDGRVGEDLFAVPWLHGTPGLVYCSNRHGKDFKIYFKKTGTKTHRKLSFGKGNDLHPSIHPALPRLAFASDRTGVWQIFLIKDLDKAEASQITHSESDCVHPSWSANGKLLAYSRKNPHSNNWEVWIYNTTTEEHRFIVEGLFAQFDPTGERLVFQRPRMKSAAWYSIWTVKLDGSRETEIASGASYGLTNPSFSPNGQWIVYNSVSKRDLSLDTNAESKSDLFMVKITGESETRLTFRPQSSQWNPHWGQDGQIYFSADSGGKVAIWSLSPPR